MWEVKVIVEVSLSKPHARESGLCMWYVWYINRTDHVYSNEDFMCTFMQSQHWAMESYIRMAEKLSLQPETTDN